MSQRYPKRKVQTLLEEPKKKAKTLWYEEYWKAFDAVRNDDWNDGQEACGAKLYYYTSGNVRELIVGATNQGAGHAEMHALKQFFSDVCDNKSDNLKAYQDRGLEIECTAKACCLRCSIILGALGFTAATDDTYKSAKPMGKTSWNLNPTMRTFLKAAKGITEDDISEIGRLTSL
jgi:hypothetical protein